MKKFLAMFLAMLMVATSLFAFASCGMLTFLCMCLFQYRSKFSCHDLQPTFPSYEQYSSFLSQFLQKSLTISFSGFGSGLTFLSGLTTSNQQELSGPCGRFSFFFTIQHPFLYPISDTHRKKSSKDLNVQSSFILSRYLCARLSIVLPGSPYLSL